MKSGSPEQQPIDERERRRQLRRQGWILCLEGVFVAGVGMLATFIIRWFFEADGFGGFLISSGVAIWLIISGLVKVVKGWDRS